MELNCPICSTSIANTKHVWTYDHSELRQCNHCGIIYHLRNDNLYLHQATTTYTKNSWGKSMDKDYDTKMRSPEIKQHIERMQFNLEYFSKFIKNLDNCNVLDVGAGIGLLEFISEQTSSVLQNSNLVMLEPVMDNYQILRNRYTNHLAINCHLNQLKNPTPSYDFIFCQGVDYLFENLHEGFEKLHNLLNHEGLLFISRNVFIDMPCYFGGESIKTANQLFAPNSLINAYFLEAHYKEFLQLNFDILNSTEYQEEYLNKNSTVGVHYNYVLKKKSPIYKTMPMENSEYFSTYTKKLSELLNAD